MKELTAKQVAAVIETSLNSFYAVTDPPDHVHQTINEFLLQSQNDDVIFELEKLRDERFIRVRKNS